MNKINERKYDLEERTAELGMRVISLCKTLPENAITKPLISQITRSATSVGANYMEANSASSKKDFKNKIYICKKETQETKHWLQMIGHYNQNKKEDAKIICQECQELTLIFGKIISSLKNSTFNQN